ncbi:hypothetical protein [Haliangium sp. UPWRP_2]|uniref:hypothetical protein n=1 Tax=Haliangium sp. UPWRP_2 TaxID=1931276 RepID=UPI0011B1F97D|nr:hypothetical protein [Haliangium sp. UPWRP_2]
MRELHRNHAWKMISTIMTRPLRSGEFEKTSVSEAEFQRISSENGFLCENALFGFKYGTLRTEVMLASDSRDEIWMLDFPLSRRTIFDNIPHTSLIVMPSSRDQLEWQLKHAGRTERLTEVLQEYDSHFSHFLKEETLTQDWIIVNTPDKVKETAQIIDGRIRNLVL